MALRGGAGGATDATPTSTFFPPPRRRIPYLPLFLAFLCLRLTGGNVSVRTETSTAAFALAVDAAATGGLVSKEDGGGGGASGGFGWLSLFPLPPSTSPTGQDRRTDALTWRWIRWRRHRCLHWKGKSISDVSKHSSMLPPWRGEKEGNGEEKTFCCSSEFLSGEPTPSPPPLTQALSTLSSSPAGLLHKQSPSSPSL
jgi:hypothetical protein